MRKILIAFYLILIYIGLSSIVKAQCSGSTTVGNLITAPLTIGDGSSTTIRVCIDDNQLGYAPGCGWEEIEFWDSDGISYGAIDFMTSDGTCYILETPGGTIELTSTCLSSTARNTVISWESFDLCGNEVCSGTGPSCVAQNCSTCNDPCGTCGVEEFYGTQAEIDWIAENCEGFPFDPYLMPGETETRCHQFVAVDATVEFGIILNAPGCTSGNISNFSWELFDDGCGTPIQTGDLSGLTFSGLTIDEVYNFCYTFTVPTYPGCLYHKFHTPIFIGAETVVLPVELITFTVDKKDRFNSINWKTASEKDNDFFKIEHSDDGENWTEIAQIDGLGNVTTEMSYSFKHQDFKLNSVNYYRLYQIDFNGATRLLDIASVDNREHRKVIKTVNLIGQEVDAYYKGIVIDFLDSGEALKRYQ